MSAGSSLGLPGRFSRASATRHDIANPVCVAPAGGGVPLNPSRAWSVPAMGLPSRPEMRGGVVRVGVVRGDGVRGGVVRACAVGQRCSVLVRPGALLISRGSRRAAPGQASEAPTGRAQRALDLSL